MKRRAFLKSLCSAAATPLLTERLFAGAATPVGYLPEEAEINIPK